MAVLAVQYDLRQPRRDYSGLYEALKEFTHCHHLDSLWYLDTGNSASEVRDKLKSHVDKDDQLIVIRLRQNWAACNKDHGTAWLKSSSRTWE
jgi:hypothetical protein